MSRMNDHNANPSLLIDWFDFFDGKDEPYNNYRWLSNFYVGAPIKFLSVEFQTGEHMFAAFKASTRKDFDYILNSPTPSVAKSRGRKIDLRPDWEGVKFDVMRAVLNLKFAPGREESPWLLDTGSAMLVEGTWWGDTVWGVDRTNGKGRNWLGILLMARRAELQQPAVEFDYSYLEKYIRTIRG